MEPFRHVTQISLYLQEIADSVIGPLSVKGVGEYGDTFHLLVVPSMVANYGLELEVYPYEIPYFGLIMKDLAKVYDEMCYPTPSVEELEALWNA